jgi:hypothetical protein
MDMRRLTIFIARAMLFLSLQQTQAQVAVVDSGACGTNLVWKITSDSILTIHGSGAMTNYVPFAPYLPPWDSLKTKFNTLKIQYGVTRIGSHAFENCTNLTGNLVIPHSVTWIDYGAFMGCSDLTGVTIPKSVVYMANDVFKDCSGLKDLIIGMDGSLPYVYIPAQVFWNCTSLTSITFLATTPPISGTAAFPYVPRNIPIYVPCGSMAAYQSAIGGIGGFTNFSVAHCLPICKVTGLANNSSLGSVSGGDDYFIGNNALLYAAPKASRTAFTSYAFTDWSDGDTNNPRTITVISDTTLTANFTLIITDSILYQRIDTLKNDTILLNNVIRGLKTDTLLLNNIIRGLKSDTIALNNAIRSLKNDTLLLNNTIRGLKSDTALLNSIIAGLKNDTVLLNSIISNLINDTILLNSIIMGLKNDTVLLNGIIAVLQTENSLLRIDTAALNLQIAILRALLDSCEKDRINLQILLDSCLHGQNNIVETHCNASLRIYPNPVSSNGVLNIEGESLQIGDKIEIYDMSGKLLSIGYASGSESFIRIGDLPKGVYLLRLAGKKGVKFEVR